MNNPSILYPRFLLTAIANCRASKMMLSCPLEITCCVHKKSLVFISYNIFLLTKLVWSRWLDITSPPPPPKKKKKKTLRVYGHLDLTVGQ